MKVSKKMALALLLFLLIVGGVAGYLMLSQRIRSRVRLKTIGFKTYWDESCTQEITEIDWGVLEQPPVSKSIDIWLKNIGTVSVSLSLTTEEWTPPEASNYIFLTWDKEGYVLHENEVTKATLTLSVSETVIGTGLKDFSFTIVLTGVEQ